MKRSRFIILCCILLALLAIPAAWKLTGPGKGGRKTGGDSRRDLGSVPATASAVGGDEGKSGKRNSEDFAAKANSMLELRRGELGIVPVPADFIDGDVPGAPAAPQSGPLLSGIVSKRSAQGLLEKALRQGSSIQAKVGAAGDGVGWKSGEIGLSVRLNNEDETFPELNVESSAGDETSKMVVQLSAGTCAIIRYPTGESVLLVIGGGATAGE